ncbi:hypothetical protein [Pseudobacillus wudalianchiensis]|uniref:hypothetical protein n=1 Tax=Pseudobacillus wudalianchiensis TaxID=1743143 RepID=UPI00159F1776|nr:hypothetical protein [Bacillus wudalianchiensis]
MYEAEKIENKGSFNAYEIGFILNRSINEKLREATALLALREKEIKNQLNN